VWFINCKKIIIWNLREIFFFGRFDIGIFVERRFVATAFFTTNYLCEGVENFSGFASRTDKKIQ
jgi:hypothetical protein